MPAEQSPHGPLADLFAEGERQLRVCNACRYCAGYCPVWPALALRTTLGTGDRRRLANPCQASHDCSTASMNPAPHASALNPPRLCAGLREQTYRRYAGPSVAARRLPVLVGYLATAAVLVLLGYLSTGRL